MCNFVTITLVIEMANRKQRRMSKEIKRDSNYEYEEGTKNIIITLVVVLLVFGLFYLITVLINNSNRKLNTTDPKPEVSEIQYYEILGDDTFTMSPDEYYVLFYDFEGPSAVYYDYMFSKYASGSDQYIYKVDLSKGFNTKFVSESTNEYASEAGELKVKDGTLIRISYGRNVEYIDSSSTDIANVLLES